MRDRYDENESLQKAVRIGRRICGCDALQSFRQGDNSNSYNLGCPDVKDYGALYLIVMAGQHLCSVRRESAKLLLAEATKMVLGDEDLL